MDACGLAEAAQRTGIRSKATADLSCGPAVAFSDAGAIELKGVAGATQLYRARRPD